MKKILRTTTILLLVNIFITLYMPYSFGLQAQGMDGVGGSGSGSGSSSSSSSGSSSQMDSYSSINKKAKEFINRGSASKTISQQKVEQDLKPLAQILMGIAVLVLLSVGAILGVKYMISGADERAKIKEKLIWYIVSAVLIFGAVAIFNIVINILNRVSD